MLQRYELVRADMLTANENHDSDDVEATVVSIPPIPPMTTLARRRSSSYRTTSNGSSGGAAVFIETMMLPPPPPPTAAVRRRSSTTIQKLQGAVSDVASSLAIVTAAAWRGRSQGSRDDHEQYGDSNPPVVQLTYADRLITKQQEQVQRQLLTTVEPYRMVSESAILSYGNMTILPSNSTTATSTDDDDNDNEDEADTTETDMSDEEWGADLITVEAQHIVQDVDLEMARHRRSFRWSGRIAASSEEYDLVHIQPAFASAIIIKTQTNRDLGLNVKAVPFMSDDNNNSNDSTESTMSSTTVLQITDIDPEGLVALGPFRVGQFVISLNQIPCKNMTPEEFYHLCITTTGTITVLAQQQQQQQQPTSRNNNNNNIIDNNIDDDGTTLVIEPSRLATLVEKPAQDVALGVRLRGTARSQIKIARIKADGLFAHSLINVGDRILALNGTSCRGMSVEKARDIIKQSHRYVTLLTETPGTTAVVMARSQSISGASLPAFALGGTSSSGLHSDQQSPSLHDESWVQFFAATFVVVFVLLISASVVFGGGGGGGDSNSGSSSGN